MNQLVRLLICAALLCLFPAAGFTQQTEDKKKEAEPDKKEDVPQGYEDAPAAGDPPAARGGMAVDFPAEEEAFEEEEAAVLDAEVDAEVAQLEKQLLPRYEPLLESELSLIRRVCKPDQQQLEAIDEAADRCLKLAVRKQAIAQNQGRARAQAGREVHVQDDGRVVRVQGGGAQAVADPDKLIREGLLEIVRKHLDAEQAGRYEEEIAKREESRRRAVVLGLVANLDEQLALTDGQREKLIESLSENWQHSWAHRLQMLISDEQYLTSIPDHAIVRLLNETQKSVWRAIKKRPQDAVGGVF